MLQFSGLGQTGNDYMECVAEHGAQDAVCQEIYLQERQQNEPSTSGDHACDYCDPNTQWCDGSRCVPFTAAEIAEWTIKGGPPPTVARTARPSLIPGISNTALAIIGALGLGALLMYKRR